jgi:hypothetical protein
MLDQMAKFLPEKKENKAEKLDKKELKGEVVEHSGKGRESLRGDVVEDQMNEYEKKVNQKLEKKELTPQQQEIMSRLKSAKSAQDRVDTFATLADTYGLDALISLFPELGDLGSSGVAGLYLLYEAKNVGLSRTSMLKIVALQAMDVAIGAIPIVGDVADYFFKANKWSASSFEKQVESIKKEARKNGVPEDEIAKLDQGASKVYKAARWGMEKTAPFLKGGPANDNAADTVKKAA